MGKRKSVEIVAGVSIWKREGEGPRAGYKLSFYCEQQKRRRTLTSSAFHDLAAEQARAIARRNDRILNGLARPAEERHAEEGARPLIEHLTEWKKTMVATARDPKHVRQMHDYARDVLAGTPAIAMNAKRGRGQRKSVEPIRLSPANFRTVTGIIASKVLERIGEIRAARSAATANRYLDAVQIFLNWGVKDKRWPTNVCDHLEPYNAAEDVRVVRRVIEPAAYAHLVHVTETAGAQSGLTGPERSLLYQFAVATGLRAGEVRGVRVGDLKLAPRLGVQTQAKTSKNRKSQFVPLPEALREALVEAAEGRAADAPLLKCPSNTARMLKRDLKLAGIPYVTGDGKFDFHAIRHECGTLLVSAGVSVKAVQQHLRHSDIRLTLQTYGHLLESDHSTMKLHLPDFTRTSAQRKAQRAESNEGLPVSADVGESEVKETENPDSTQESGSDEWSHGESNSDLLNAIQPSSR